MSEPNESHSPEVFGPFLWVRKTGVSRQLTAAEMRAWTLYEDERLLVINKPGDVVCHPSKDGPWSSLVGAAKAYLGIEAVHLVFRLDRETSGVVVMAKEPKMGARLHKAVMERRYTKMYQAILTGELRAEVRVDQPLGKDIMSPVTVKSTVVVAGEPGAQNAITLFTPERVGGGFTLARVVTETGRKHQIRAHAQWLGHSLVGDKIYGPDPRLFLEFVESGFTERLARELLLKRQALHCAEVDLRPAGLPWIFTAPLPEDLAEFVRTRMG